MLASLRRAILQHIRPLNALQEMIYGLVMSILMLGKL